MSKYGSADVAFFAIDGYNLLGYTTEFNEETELVTEETHTLGDSWVEQSVVGLRRATISQQGFYDDEANGSNEALVALSGSDRVLCYGLAGNTIGRGFRGTSGALQSKYDRVVSRGALHRANASYQIDGAVHEGKILHALGAETADGNTQSSSVDNAASSANGGFGYLQVTALNLDGGTSVTVDVRHSTDNAVWATHTSFTNVTTAPTAQRLTLAGTINRYAAARHTFNGGAGSGKSITYMAGLYRA